MNCHTDRFQKPGRLSRRRRAVGHCKEMGVPVHSLLSRNKAQHKQKKRLLHLSLYVYIERETPIYTIEKKTCARTQLALKTHLGFRFAQEEVAAAEARSIHSKYRRKAAKHAIQGNGHLHVRTPAQGFQATDNLLTRSMVPQCKDSPCILPTTPRNATNRFQLSTLSLFSLLLSLFGSL